MNINVCVAGATGWVGADLSRAIHTAEDLNLSGAIARSAAGRPLGEVLDIPGLDLVVSATAQEALAKPCDVFVEFSTPEAAKAHVLHALAAGAHVVVGTDCVSTLDVT
jgi:4-hydroxy-tetrahydrodipicolinate reductase